MHCVKVVWADFEMLLLICSMAQIIQLRNRLGIRRQDGFVLTSERAPLWQRRDRTVFILSAEIEAAARLALMMSFDVRNFDAFCHCIEYSAMTLQWENPAPSKTASLQYIALCDWLIDLCQRLIEPPVLKKYNRKASSLCSFSQSTVFTAASQEEDSSNMIDLDSEICNKEGARERFLFFRQLVLRARIWQDHEQTLFLRLKEVASEYMDKIAPMCDARFDRLRREPFAADLIKFGEISECGENGLHPLKGHLHPRSVFVPISKLSLPNEAEEYLDIRPAPAIYPIKR